MIRQVQPCINPQILSIFAVGRHTEQGFGRLTRSAKDSGNVVVLDPRIVGKRYGRLFIESLPECKVVRHAEPV